MSLFHGRNVLKSVFANTSVLVVDRIVRYGLGFFIGAAIARYLGPAQYGLLNFVLALVAILMPVMGVGLDNIVIREIAQEPDNSDEILGSALFVRAAAGLVMVALALGACIYFKPNDSLALTLVFIQEMATLMLCFDVIEVWFQSQLKARYPVYGKGAAFLAICVVKVILIVTGASIHAIIWAGFAEAALGAIGLLYFYHRSGYSIFRFKFRRARTVHFWNEGWTLVLAGIASVVGLRIDQLIISKVLGDAALGIYSAAFRFSEFAFNIPALIAVSILPLLVQSKVSSQATYDSRVIGFMGGMAYIGFFIAASFSILAGILIPRLFGPAYIDATSVLYIQIWSCVFVFLTIASNQHLVVQRRTDIILVRTITSMVVSVALNILFIPRYGLHGAATVSIVSNAVSVIIPMCYPTQRSHMMDMLIACNPFHLRESLRTILQVRPTTSTTS